MNEILYLDKEDIIESHLAGFRQFGGKTYGIDESCVEKRVIEPQTSYWGEEQYPGLFRKAAVYMYRITISHCFSDGNKRVAFLCTDLFLRYNQFKFSATTDELYDFCLRIANHATRPDLDIIEEWIRSNTVPFTLEEPYN
ncbi:type II toxin-antitoxin system death-on-curing family toxin [Sporosarcina obsidiansis]|uniref:type II toxin-antitoxin system death-on-curing family toxin n=1 Tax=Sporosarcina obsidiansis TaxID=2660748 RepID=UPI0018911711|nr:type II toxin-antitoxin system death-on-curing family toxin [Sporosarcina obsidiansis]